MKFFPKEKEAFTLIELLVSLTLIAAIAAVSISSISLFKRQAMMGKEMTAARNLMVAFNLYSNDNDGAILPGYKTDLSAKNQWGETLAAPVNARYPWRLYPYIHDVTGTLVYNGNEPVFNHEHGDYLVSVSPNLGMNTTFIGGHFGAQQSRIMCRFAHSRYYAGMGVRWKLICSKFLHFGGRSGARKLPTPAQNGRNFGAANARIQSRFAACLRHQVGIHGIGVGCYSFVAGWMGMPKLICTKFLRLGGPSGP